MEDKFAKSGNNKIIDEYMINKDFDLGKNNVQYYWKDEDYFDFKKIKFKFFLILYL